MPTGFSAFDIGACNCPTCSGTIHVEGCNNIAISGQSVEIYDTSGGTLLDSGTTNGSGDWAYGPIPIIGGGSTYWVQFPGMSSRFSTANNAFYGLACGSSTAIQLSTHLATGYHCITCAIPIAATLYATFSGAGVCTLTWTGSGWAGQIVGLNSRLYDVGLSTAGLLQVYDDITLAVCISTSPTITCSPAFSIGIVPVVPGCRSALGNNLNSITE